MPLSLWPHCHGTTNKELQRDIEQRGCCGLGALGRHESNHAL